MRVRVLAALAAAVTALALAPPGHAADGESSGALHAEEIRAFHGETPIDVGKIRNFHCHDAAWPVISCFDSAPQRDLHAKAVQAHAELEPAASTATSDELLTTSSLVAYVRWYEHINYAGSSFVAYGAYSDLSSIGWNDAISSFKSLNGQRPKWWEHWYEQGVSWHWPAGAHVADLRQSFANDVFSSVRNVP